MCPPDLVDSFPGTEHLAITSQTPRTSFESRTPMPLLGTTHRDHRNDSFLRACWQGTAPFLPEFAIVHAKLTPPPQLWGVATLGLNFCQLKVRLDFPSAHGYGEVNPYNRSASTCFELPRDAISPRCVFIRLELQDSKKQKTTTPMRLIHTSAFARTKSNCKWNTPGILKV
jgi:hypothetical protein